jgi:hypothetical protein
MRKRRKPPKRRRRKRQEPRPKRPRKVCTGIDYFFSKYANAEADDEKEDAPVQRVDDDPDGHKLIKATDPLEQAAKLLEPLLDLPHNNPDIWVAFYDVSIRRSM